MRAAGIFAQDFKTDPYWWETGKPSAPDPATLPEEVDIAIIGAGYTGLHAAIQTARAGHSTAVLDAEHAGWGCSTRNGGQVSTSIKPSYALLKKRYGEKLAVEILREGKASLDFITRFIVEERIDCAFGAVGRFHGAHTAALYEKLTRECDAMNPVFRTDAYVVPKAEQHRELGTDVYHGGIVYPHHASVDPGRYFSGVCEVAIAAGARIFRNCRVSALHRQGEEKFLLETARGRIRARRVIIATNGYTGPLTPWHRQRVIPIGSYVIATEEIEKKLFDRLIPTDRVLSDTRKLVYYFRPSPDRKRILFGGRVSLGETDTRISAARLHAELIRIFPDLKEVRISHSWMGYVGYTFDTLMHTGEDSGLFYAMGYCGSGVGMASYLGMRIGRHAAGLEAGAGAFDHVPFQTRPFYYGKPWFLAPSVLVYRLRDRLGI